MNLKVVWIVNIQRSNYCKNFLTGFSCDGGPGPSASDSIREDWKEVLKEGGDEDLITYLQYS